jgi:hypothetical protein
MVSNQSLVLGYSGHPENTLTSVEFTARDDISVFFSSIYLDRTYQEGLVGLGILASVFTDAAEERLYPIWPCNEDLSDRDRFALPETI